MVAWVKYEEKSSTEGEFILQPLKKGMGTTIGNSIRRVLLSSLSGYSVRGLKISGVNHEFTTIPNVVEDVLEIICNIKNLIFKMDTTECQVVSINVKNKKIYTANDIQCPEGVSVVNKDVYLFELTEVADFKIDIFVTFGFGYNEAKSNAKDEDSSDIILLDSNFSPITKVNHTVDLIRVGRELDHDSLKLNVHTNGIKSPLESVEEAVQILNEHYALFDTINEAPEEDKSEESTLEDQRMQSILKMSVDELELSARSSNCLKRAGIKDVQELIDKEISDLEKIKNFGKKSADEINNKLKQYNLSIKGTENES